MNRHVASFAMLGLLAGHVASPSPAQAQKSIKTPPGTDPMPPARSADPPAAPSPERGDAATGPSASESRRKGSDYSSVLKRRNARSARVHGAAEKRREALWRKQMEAEQLQLAREIELARQAAALRVRQAELGIEEARIRAIRRGNDEIAYGLQQQASAAALANPIRIRGQLTKSLAGGWAIAAYNQTLSIANPEQFSREGWFRVGVEVDAIGRVVIDPSASDRDGVSFELESLKSGPAAAPDPQPSGPMPRVEEVHQDRGDREAGSPTAGRKGPPPAKR